MRDNTCRGSLAALVLLNSRVGDGATAIGLNDPACCAA